MKMLKLLGILSLLIMVSCSGSKNKDGETEDLEESVVLSDDSGDEFEDLEGVEDVEDVALSEEQPIEMMEETVEEVALNEGGGFSEYVVQENDTLMWIAFKLYGDYEMWKKLAIWNRDSIRGAGSIAKGQVLKYTPPAQEFVWNPQGEPWLIKKGDTLAGISQNVYGTKKKWRSIYDNNRPMIKDPHLIFAGFTLYYLTNPDALAYNK